MKRGIHMNNSDGRAKIRFIQLFIFTPLIYIGICGAFNYLIYTLRCIKDINNPDRHFEFHLKWLIYCEPLGLYMTILISVALAMLMVMKLDQNWRIKNGNKDIKGEAHFLELKDVEKILYGVDEKNLSDFTGTVSSCRVSSWRKFTYGVSVHYSSERHGICGNS